MKGAHCPSGERRALNREQNEFAKEQDAFTEVEEVLEVAGHL